MNVVATQGLSKRYGRIQALNSVSLQVNAGEIFGLLGQNGAGKSTLIKILLGIVQKTAGDATLLGQPVGDVAIRREVGYLPEDHQFPAYHTARTLLDVYGRLYGLPRSERRQRMEESLGMVGLRKRADDRIRSYSKGMKQRLGIAQAIFHQPNVIFLDEPTDGVDPVGRREIRDMLEQLRDRGATIFINSHLLGEVELICNRVAILQRGEIIRIGSVAELTREANRFVLGLAPGETFPMAAVAAMGHSARAVGNLVELELPTPETIDAILRMLHEQGLHLRHLVQKSQSLEEVFVRTVDGAEPGTERQPAARS